jgi:hypothetical protein
MPGPSGEKCEDCYYWEPSLDQDDPPLEGECHRNPPSIKGKEPDFYFFLLIDALEWCGEFRAKDSQQ